ncbi:hypothetical protein [Roseiconus lacunae]|uniref:hypothetical protein n=1 Tax=Roseiconus lacunae TaxID=2605694 RepID=UPI001E5B3B95|nr:hypothetical protein [Roseiconus lacunae]MCD0462389.1 hypothetical protein [Roseiconus lacunae]
MTNPNSVSSTQVVHRKFPGPFQSRLDKEGVDLSFDVFCQTTKKVLVSVRYWHEEDDARHNAAVIVDALNGNHGPQAPKLDLPGPFTIELSDVPPSLVYVICQTTDGFVVGVDYGYMDDAIQIGEWIAHALNMHHS